MMECPFCGKSEVDGRHIRFCSKNPESRNYKATLEQEPQPVKGEYAESPEYAEQKAREAETEQLQKEQQPDLLKKLKTLGIEPDQIIAALSPLVEASVIQTLEKMQLGEAINKKVSEAETKLSGQIQETLKPLQQMTSQPSGDTQPQDTQLRDTILAGLAQKFLNPNPGSSLDSLLAQQVKIGQLVDAFTKPYRDAEEATLKRVNLMLGIGAKAGLTPKETIEKTQGIE